MRELSGKSLSVDLQEEGELRRRAGTPRSRPLAAPRSAISSTSRRTLTPR